MQPRLLVAAGAVLLTTAGPALADNITVMVNGNRVQFPNAQPTQIAGRVMIPLRGVLNRLGAERVQWRPRRQEIFVTGLNGDMRLRIGERVAIVRGQPVELDVPPMIIQNTTMVPLRFVSENLGARVDWLSGTRTVYIATPSERVAGRRETLPAEDPNVGAREPIRPRRGAQRAEDDREPPVQSAYLTGFSPRHNSLVSDPRPEIAAQFRPNVEVDYGTVRLFINDRDVTRDAQITAEGVRYLPMDDLRQGRNDVRLTFRDTRGIETSQEWFFFAP